MYYLPVETLKGIINEPVYSVNDFPFEKFKGTQIVKNRSTKNRCMYYNIPAAFDIETTTIDGYKDKKGKYVKGLEPYSFIYHWQFCLDTTVIFGRRIDDMVLFFQKLSDFLNLNEHLRLIVYVHNLAFEFQFIKDFLGIDSIFARKPHKPMKYITNNFEFRCSYFLSNMSLAKFSENSPSCYHRKLSGDDYDYKKIRTPDTPMTVYELGYCYNDVRGLCECIRDKINDENSHSIADIPLTSTGYVRRDIKKAVLPPGRGYDTKRIYRRNRELIGNLTLSIEEYRMLKKCFRGGNTHANRFFTGHIMSDVHSFDIKSSYPAVILYDYFPMKKFIEIEVPTNKEELYYYINKYCCMFTIWYKDLKAKDEYPIPYISISKCEEISLNNKELRTELLNDNGRVLKATYAQMTITEIDFNIIDKTYDFEGYVIDNFYIAERGKLPKEFRQEVMNYFHTKTILAHDESKEYEKNKSKNKLNSTYGMCVTDILNPDAIYENNNWTKKEMTEEEELEGIGKYNNYVRFLFYAGGIWITAHARRRLQIMLDIVKRNVVYTDTDSIKFIDPEKELYQKFIDRNNEILEDAKQLDISPTINEKIEINGKEIIINDTMGIWEYEGYYTKFKTLGAKKYCYYHSKKPDKFCITVSGMDKAKGAKAVKDFSGFMPGKQYSNIGRTVSYYNEAPPHEIEIQGCRFITASNVAIVDTTYKFNITDEYQKVLGYSGNNFMMEVE